jgi:hypothetical protein
MFRSTRDDTLIKTIEARYGIDLHARGDTRLGNLLEHRGFLQRNTNSWIIGMEYDYE